MHILAINCGSSSIKGKLYNVPEKHAETKVAASLSVSGISSKGEKVKISVKWNGEQGTNVDEEGEDGGSVECELSAPWPLDEIVAHDKTKVSFRSCCRS